MPKVTFLPMNQTVDAEMGESILDVAIRHDVPLQHACGGFCACTTCHVEVKSGDDKLSAMEDDEEERLDRAVGVRPEAPLAPATAPEPEPAVEATAQPTPEPPASGEQANDQAEGGTMLERVRRFFEQNPTETVNAPQLGPRLGCLAKHVSPSLSILFREGYLEKPRLGFYRLARKSRRAA